MTERRQERTLFLFLLLLFALGAHGYVDNPDAEVEYQTARALVRRGSTALSEHFADASTAERVIVRERHGVMRGRDGAFYSWYGPGHMLVMVPFYVAGEWLAQWFPGVEARVTAHRAQFPGPLLGRDAGEEFWAHLVVSFHSPLFGALCGLVLLRLLGHFGFRGAVRIAAVLIATLSGQFGPETRESMSDTTATFFLLWSLERAVAWRIERSGRVALVAAGILGGAAVLARVNHVLPIIALGVYVAWYAVRRGQESAVAWFAAGGLPSALFLLWFNWSRFGSALESGQSAGAAHQYWSFPFWLGFLALGFSPGKGVFWFCPVLFLAPWGLKYLWRSYRSEVCLIVAYFLLPWVLCSFMTGWHSAQAWACRYMTPGAVLVSAVVAASVLRRCATQPSRRLTVALAGLATAGLLINLGGWITPYRGFYNILLQHPVVIDTLWPGVTASHGDPFQHLVLDARTSPILGHWKYAWLSWNGTIPDGPGADAFAFLTGTAIEAPVRPAFIEDSGFRHLWPIGLSWQLGSAVPTILGLVMLVATCLVGWQLVRLRREEDAS